MNQDGHARCSAAHVLLLCVGLWGTAGCSSTQAAYPGTGGSGMAGAVPEERRDAPAKSGDAIAQPVECNQTDSTVSCCLKKNPGQYERCGAVAPNQGAKQTPKRAPKDDTGPVKPPPIPPPEERRERERRCREFYYQCIARGGEYEKRGQYGQTICQSCYEICKGSGSWPAEVNGFECLGGD